MWGSTLEEFVLSHPIRAILDVVGAGAVCTGLRNLDLLTVLQFLYIHKKRGQPNVPAHTWGGGGRFLLIQQPNPA